MEVIIGIAIVAFATVTLVVLTLWSNARINSLAEQDFPTAHDLMKRKNK